MNVAPFAPLPVTCFYISVFLSPVVASFGHNSKTGCFLTETGETDELCFTFSGWFSWACGRTQVPNYENFNGRIFSKGTILLHVQQQQY